MNSLSFLRTTFVPIYWPVRHADAHRGYTNQRFTLINFDRSSETNGSLIVQWPSRLSSFCFVLRLLWLTLRCEWKELNDSIISGELQYLLKIYLSNKSCSMCVYVILLYDIFFTSNGKTPYWKIWNPPDSI